MFRQSRDGPPRWVKNIRLSILVPNRSSKMNHSTQLLPVLNSSADPVYAQKKDDNIIKPMKARWSNNILESVHFHSGILQGYYTKRYTDPNTTGTSNICEARRCKIHDATFNVSRMWHLCTWTPSNDVKSLKFPRRDNFFFLFHTYFQCGDKGESFEVNCTLERPPQDASCLAAKKGVWDES